MPVEKPLNVEELIVVGNQTATNVEKLKNNSTKLDTKWRDKANCLGVNTDMFFAEKDYANKDLLERICSRCDVQLECLAFALKHDVTGWWSGTSDLARRPIRKAMGLPDFSLDEWLPVEEATTEELYSEFEDEWM